MKFSQNPIPEMNPNFIFCWPVQQIQLLNRLKYHFNISILSDLLLVKSGYIDVDDGCWRRNVLATTLRCWWGFGRFCHPLSFNISVGHQHPKDLTNIENLSLTSKNSKQDKVNKIHLSPTSSEVFDLYPDFKTVSVC